MAIDITSTDPRVSYAGDGSTTVFAVPFEFYANADLKVYVAGALQTITTHYTVTGAGVAGGGSVTFLVAPANAASVVIYSDPVIQRLSHFPLAGPFNTETLNRQLNELTIYSKRLRDRILRGLRLADSDATASLELPAPAARANKVLGFDTNGNVMMAPGATLGGVLVSSYAATLLDDANAAAARSTLGAGDASYPTQGADLASATTLALPADEAAQYFNVTGNTTIAGISARSAGRLVELRFLGTPQLTHNGTTFSLPTGANIVAAAGDVARFRAISGGWQCVGYQRASGASVLAPQQRLVGTTIVQNPYAINATVSGAHGLGAVPHEVRLELECITIDLNYAVGDKVQLSDGVGYVITGGAALSVSWDATNVTVISANNTILNIPDKSSRTLTAITPARWRLNIYPIRWA